MKRYRLNNLGKNNYLVVVCFDTRDDKRRRKINKFLRYYGIRVQYSVYECLVNMTSYEKLISEIVTYINNEDDLRIYRLNPLIEITSSNEYFSGEDKVEVI